LKTSCGGGGGRGLAEKLKNRIRGGEVGLFAEKTVLNYKRRKTYFQRTYTICLQRHRSVKLFKALLQTLEGRGLKLKLPALFHEKIIKERPVFFLSKSCSARKFISVDTDRHDTKLSPPHSNSPKIFNDLKHCCKRNRRGLIFIYHCNSY